MCQSRSLAWGRHSFGFFTAWACFTLDSTALQETIGSSLSYSGVQSIKCPMLRPNCSADPPPSKEVCPSMFATESSCKTSNSISLPTDCLKVSHVLAFACLSFSKKICIETHKSVEHLWIKMCNFHHNVLTVEDLPLFNAANCVLQMCWSILCGSQQGRKCILAIDVTFLVFSVLPEPAHGKSFKGAEASREKVLRWRKLWGTVKGEKNTYLYSRYPTSYQTASGKRCVGVSFNLVSAAE